MTIAFVRPGTGNPTREVPLTHRRQRGVVLVVALVFLLVLTILGITAMNTASLQGRMAGNTQETNRAFQGAESALDRVWKDGSVFASINQQGDTVTDPASPHSYAGASVNVDVTWKATVCGSRAQRGEGINPYNEYATAVFEMNSAATTATNAATRVIQGINQIAPGANCQQ